MTAAAEGVTLAGQPRPVRAVSWYGVTAASATTAAAVLLALWAFGGTRPPAGGLASPGWGLVWWVAAVALVNAAWLTAAPEPSRAGLTALVAGGWVGALASAVPGAAPGLRPLAVAVAALLPVAVALLGLPTCTGDRWSLMVAAGLASAGAAGLLRASVYDPLRDPACVRYCAPGSGWWSSTVAQPPARLAVAVLVTTSVAIVVVAAVLRAQGALTATAPALVAGALAAAAWSLGLRGEGTRGDDIAALAVAVSATSVVTRRWAAVRRRRGAYRLLDSIERGVAQDRTISSVDEASAPPALRLALVNARLAADATDQEAALRGSRSRIVEAADLERHRLGRELHDTVQQRVVGALLQCRIAADTESDHARRVRLLAAAEALGSVLPHLRGITERAAPTLVDSDGLAAAVEQRAEALAGLRLDVRGDGSTPPPTAARQAYIIIDCLLDSVTGAPPTELTLSLVTEQDSIRMMFAGPGVVVPEVLGDRIAAAGGTLSELEDCAPSAGGAVKVVVPCVW